MKRIFSFMIAVALMFSFAASATAAADNTVNEAPKLVSVDGNTITIKDDGTGESGEKSGMDKQVVLTNMNINYKGETGPFTYEIQGIQISKIKTSDEGIASLMGIEIGQETAMVAIQVSVENTSREDMAFYPYMSTIITSDKEQVASNWFLSDSVGGTFYGNVVMDGQIFWFCPKTNAENLTHIQWRIDPPVNDDYLDVGDKVIIEFEFPKD